MSNNRLTIALLWSLVELLTIGWSYYPASNSQSVDYCSVVEFG